MTAEVAVMNKSAIALAADSAVTGPYKIYNSINKLFRLSDYHPVGIMIYGRAEIMGIPWESVIKTYRQHLGKKHETHLRKYADSFIEYLKTYRAFADSERKAYVRFTIHGYLHSIQNEVGEPDLIPAAERNTKILDVVRRQLKALTSQFVEFPEIPSDFRDELEKLYGSETSVYINQVFKEYNVVSTTSDEIKKFCFECLSRCFFADYSGVVIAGFGEDEIFPSFVEYEIEGEAYGTHLKYHVNQEQRVGFDNPATIAAFAQQEMVKLFFEGIHPDVKQHSKSFLQNLFVEYEKKILSAVKGSTKKGLATVIKEANKVFLQEYDKAVQKHQAEDHVRPVLATVGMLPKDELAAMAESLINLTVLKRRVSTDRETVGGPIDVVVISKGDGFIWIKRKHYFTKDLNPRYVTQYFPISELTQPTDLT